MSRNDDMVFRNDLDICRWILVSLNPDERTSDLKKVS